MSKDFFSYFIVHLFSEYCHRKFCQILRIRNFCSLFSDFFCIFLFALFDMHIGRVSRESITNLLIKILNRFSFVFFLSFSFLQFGCFITRRCMFTCFCPTKIDSLVYCKFINNICIKGTMHEREHKESSTFLRWIQAFFALNIS